MQIIEGDRLDTLNLPSGIQQRVGYAILLINNGLCGNRPLWFLVIIGIGGLPLVLPLLSCSVILLCVLRSSCTVVLL